MGEIGYTFQSDVVPTRPRNFGGSAGVVWEEGSVGVRQVPIKSGFVQIPVRIVNG